MNIKNINDGIGLPLLIVTALVGTGCSTAAKEQTETVATTTSSSLEKETQLNEKEIELSQREALVKRQLEELNSNKSNKHEGDQLLPPNAKSGECYVRVWKEPQYKTIQNKVLVSPEIEKLTTVPARYDSVQEKVLISEASSKVISVPAVYKNQKEQVEITKADRSWRIMPYPSSALVSEDVLMRAEKHGINLGTASPGMCFHEHSIDAIYETVKEPILVKEASEKIISVPATYRTVEKKVMVKEASTRLVSVPAQYDTISEKIVDKPAHQIWKKGEGAIQKIDESTGEIMCLVDVPTTYKTIKKQVLRTPASTKTIDIPAEYKTVSVKELVSEATEKRIKIPAEYASLDKKKLVSGHRYVWHEIHDKSLSKKSRTGNQICLVDTPAELKTVNKKVIVTPASTTTTAIPATYKTVNVQKLVEPAKVNRHTVPAVYKTTQRQELIADGKLEWRSILCETNMTTNRISDIQRALVNKGYKPGKIDGIIGPETMSAVNNFQRDNNLPVDKYLNIPTVKALNVSTQ